jgi:hypothetical protein
MSVIDVFHFKENGRLCVTVPVGKTGKLAVLYEVDFGHLMKLGLSPKWGMLSGQVFVYNSGRQLPIARIIRHAGPGLVVLYLDNNTLNLRLDNLRLAPGNALYDTKRLVVRPHKQRHTIDHLMKD